MLVLQVIIALAIAKPPPTIQHTITLAWWKRLQIMVFGRSVQAGPPALRAW